jgi:hypothetical protein
MTREIIFEFLPNGNSVKVTAFDVETKIEVSTITPRNISKELQEQAVLNKLLYMIEKKEIR